MTPLRHLAITVAPFLVSGACAQLIGLSDYEKGDVSGSAGDGEEGGESGAGGSRGGNGGSSGNQNGGSGGRGGSRTGGEGGGGGGLGGDGGDAGDAGDAGTGGEPQGGRGGMGGAVPQGGAAGGGMGGMGGSAGGGNGGTAGSMNCTTVPVAVESSYFDEDASAWLPYSDGAAIPIIVTGESLGITAESPPNVAHLAGADDLYSGQFQSVTIPAGAVTLTLTGYRQAVTDEYPDGEYDKMGIQMWEDALNPTDDSLVADFVYYTNLNPTNGWTQFTSSAAVSAYAGQTVDFDMWSLTDSTVLTHFYIDSLALSALVCQ